ncbi:hypothetical protein PRZ48_000190 [Zasmidium cellare]|uniref:Uncharacterized protein n=1 Tax=Zasmidium cellare TaxID=395010 RepID=A0ABR0EZE3_ZASCE|nr:hypothetical protein PRZ48_000190 [Zasmidium cellare]
MSARNTTPPHLRKKKAAEKKSTDTENSLVLVANDSAKGESSSVSSPAANKSNDASATPTDNTQITALVPYGISTSLSPMEIIQHETVRNLQALLDDAQGKLKAAHDRCDQLQAENDDLRRQISEDGEASGKVAGASNGETLCGYAESEADEEEVVSNGKYLYLNLPLHSALTTHRHHRTGPAVHSGKQAELEATLGRQEKVIEALISQLPNKDQHQPQTFEQNHTITTNEYRELVDKIANLQQAVAAIQHSPRTSKPNFQTRIERKIAQEERVDNAHLRQDLIHFYEILTEQIDGKEVGDGFEGTEDEFWVLRDRVVCRLAIFEQYGEALAEAKAAMKYNGKGGGGSGRLSMIFSSSLLPHLIQLVSHFVVACPPAALLVQKLHELEKKVAALDISKGESKD